MSYRTDTPGSTPQNTFTDGDPVAGEEATIVGGQWMTENAQEDSIRTIEQEGITLVKGTVAVPNPQLPEAVRSAGSFGRAELSRNLFGNPQFTVGQRDAQFNFTGGKQYTLDRWLVDSGGGNIDVERLSFSSGLSPVREANQFVRLIADGAAGSPVVLEQRFEFVVKWSEDEVTVSFYAAAAAGTLQVIPKFVQHFGSGSIDPDVVIQADPIEVGTIWTRYKATVTLPTVAGKDIQPGSYLAVQLAMPSGLAFQQDFTNAQFERGPYATWFEGRYASAELSIVERYLSKTYDLLTPPGTIVNAGQLQGEETNTNNLTLESMNFRFRTRMRVIPAVTFYDPLTGQAGRVNIGGVSTPVTGIQNSSRDQSGAPVVSAMAGGLHTIRAHVVADAEL